ncbi:HNH endonuclease [Tenacibaculum sp.]|uniref:HNH endonuclease n=1 Tax=Tenacibaculum sp. TaxID=1906242 RepID=UPI003AA7C4E8
MMLTSAKELIFERIYNQALNHNSISSKTKNIIRSQKSIVGSLQKVGDIHRFLLNMVSSAEDSPAYTELTSNGIDTYESLLPLFESRFKEKLNDKSRLCDFIVGNQYTARQMLAAIDKYDTRLGGIQLHEKNNEVEEIFIKATLNDGKYPNEWLSEDKILKYYMKSVGTTFKESYKDNAAIINSEGISIHTFVRSNISNKEFTYKGVFKYLGHITDLDGKKWFKLGLVGADESLTSQEVISNFEGNVERAKQDNSESRKKRLKKAPKLPKKRFVMTTVFDRNPDVVAEVLERAKGQCESCLKEAPFKRKKDNTPYLEVHHIKPLAEGGEDTIENAIALCPNCHREKHFG